MESCKEMGGVRKSCRDMKKKGKHRTDESEPTIPKFFKFMVPDFKTQLRIPEKFLRNFREELPQMISLKGLSGSTWRVCVRRSKEEVLLCCGWDRFVEDHQVQETEFLCFSTLEMQHSALRYMKPRVVVNEKLVRMMSALICRRKRKKPDAWNRQIKKM